MHYRNGRAALLGDRVIGRDYAGLPVAGIVVNLQPGSSTCNIQVLPVPQTGVPTYTASEFLHIDDAHPATPKT